jgi:hypothetical protein
MQVIHTLAVLPETSLSIFLHVLVYLLLSLLLEEPELAQVFQVNDLRRFCITLT